MANALQAIFDRAYALHNAGQLQEAIALYEKVVSHAEQNASLWLLLGTAKLQTGSLREGVALIQRSIAIDPSNPYAFGNIAAVQGDLGESEAALKNCQRAIALKPDYAEAYFNQGNAFKNLKRFDEALQSYAKAIALKTDYAEAYTNQGSVLSELKRFDEALQSYAKAIALKPDDAEAHLNRGMRQLLLGNYQEGLELYEWRLKKDPQNDASQLPPHIIQWRGGHDLRGKTLLVYTEQGRGDVIQCCRYLPLLSELGAKIIFGVPASLATLVSTLNCEFQHVAEWTRLTEFDACCPIMSLPLAFKTTLETIPATTPYLHADPAKVAAWNERLGEKTKLRVGLSWSGAEQHKDDAERSIALQQLLPLIDVPVEWHSLQKEYRQKDLEILNRIPVSQHQNELHDFSDTAALAQCMDLIISVDTSIAHLGGAIGKPVWLLNRFNSDWRWLNDTKTSPWYPLTQIFRQPSYGDWNSVIAEVETALRAQIANEG